ncbi:hypothetical protein JCM10296v2_004249 [Rhodotorula toruloides]
MPASRYTPRTYKAYKTKRVVRLLLGNLSASKTRLEPVRSKGSAGHWFHFGQQEGERGYFRQAVRFGLPDDGPRASLHSSSGRSARASELELDPSNAFAHVPPPASFPSSPHSRLKAVSSSRRPSLVGKFSDPFLELAYAYAWERKGALESESSASDGDAGGSTTSGGERDKRGLLTRRARKAEGWRVWGTEWSGLTAEYEKEGSYGGTNRKADPVKLVGLMNSIVNNDDDSHRPVYSDGQRWGAPMDSSDAHKIYLGGIESTRAWNVPEEGDEEGEEDGKGEGVEEG